jgi:hypothetical protein
MKKMLLLLFLIPIIQLNAQYWEKVDSIFNPSGVRVKSFSAPAFADFNGDGHLDLLLGNLSSEAEFFINKGTGEFTFNFDTTVLSTIYDGSHIANGTYPAFVELDGDDKLEIVISGYGGILYYQNKGTISNPVWLKNDFVFADVNSQIGTDAKPAFADLDGDGDLDLVVGIGESLFGGPTAGVTLGFRNTGDSTSPNFVLDNSLVTGIPDIGLNSYPTFIDLDNDGDYDLLLGRDLQTFYYYVNTGTPQAPTWTRNTSLFSGVEATTYWKNPIFADVDGDNDFDLIYGTDSGILYVYENKGTPTSPSFQYNGNYFSVIKLDGSGASVSFADYDNNGTFDMVSGIWTGKMTYFKNEGTKNNPKFKKTTMPFSSMGVSSYSSPMFVDLDKDNDYDIVTGALAGTISYFVNTNGNFVANNSIFGSIDVGYFSYPAFADLNGDGNIDMLVGAETASDVKFFLNTGDNNFVVDNSFMQGVTFTSNARPAFADVDNDGDYDLVIGRTFGTLNYYENIGTPQTPQWLLNTQTFADVKVNQNAAPGFADLDGDTRPDLVIGEYNGNFTFFRNLFAPVSVKNDADVIIPSKLSVSNYPNPFNGQTRFHYSLPSDGEVSLVIYSILGEMIYATTSEIKKAGEYSFMFNGDNLSSGVYFYKIYLKEGASGRTNFAGGKFVMLK